MCADDVLEVEEEEEARGGQGYSYDDLAAAMDGDEELLDDGGPREDAEGQCMGVWKVCQANGVAFLQRSTAMGEGEDILDSGWEEEGERGISLLKQSVPGAENAVLLMLRPAAETASHVQSRLALLPWGPNKTATLQTGLL